MTATWTVPTTGAMYDEVSAFPSCPTDCAVIHRPRFGVLARNDREQAALYPVYGQGNEMFYVLVMPSATVESITPWSSTQQTTERDFSTLLGIVGVAHPLEPLFPEPIKFKITELPTFKPQIRLDPFLFESNE